MKSSTVVAAAVVAGAAAAAAAATMAVAVHRKRQSRLEKARAIMESLQQKCATPIEKLLQLADAMTAEMHAGLS
ncbi:HXK1 [Linum perenne]